MHTFFEKAIVFGGSFLEGLILALLLIILSGLGTVELVVLTVILTAILYVVHSRFIDYMIEKYGGVI